MLRFGAQSSSNLVWGQRTLGVPISPDESNTQQLAIHPWLSLPGQTTGGIGHYRTATGQPLNVFVQNGYLLDTYITSYIYTQGQYSFALEVHITLSEALNLSDAVPVNVIYGVTLAEALNIASADVSVNSLTSSLQEALHLADSYAFNVIYGLTLAETLNLSDTILSNAALTAYVTNLNTGAVSVYKNFNFNSFAKIGHKYYAAGDDGIYELSGGTDSGTNIDASIVLGTETFASDTISPESMKRVTAAYLGVKTDGSVLLKVTANDATNTYTLSPTAQTSLHTGRLLLGKGVTSRYWDFEITNVDGSDITLESVTFYPVALTRRIVES